MICKELLGCRRVIKSTAGIPSLGGLCLFVSMVECHNILGWLQICQIRIREFLIEIHSRCIMLEKTHVEFVFHARSWNKDRTYDGAPRDVITWRYPFPCGWKELEIQYEKSKHIFYLASLDPEFSVNFNLKFSDKIQVMKYIDYRKGTNGFSPHTFI